MLSRDCYIVKQNSRKRFLIPIYDISFPIFKAYTFLPFFTGRHTRPLGGVCVCVCVCTHTCLCVLGQEITTLLSMLGSNSFSEIGRGRSEYPSLKMLSVLKCRQWSKNILSYILPFYFPKLTFLGCLGASHHF